MMKPVIFLYLTLAMSFLFTGFYNVNSGTALAPAAQISKIDRCEFTNIALYHYALFISGNESSQIWLKENNHALYHLGNVFRYANGSSLKWLKENSQDLYHYSNFLTDDEGTLSRKWLKENNQGLYQLANLLRYHDQSSLQWLHKNNKGLYHLGNFMTYGADSSLKWLKEN